MLKQNKQNNKNRLKNGIKTYLNSEEGKILLPELNQV
jgi:hypothetical protein